MRKHGGGAGHKAAPRDAPVPDAARLLQGKEDAADGGACEQRGSVPHSTAARVTTGTGGGGHARDVHRRLPPPPPPALKRAPCTVDSPKAAAMPAAAPALTASRSSTLPCRPPSASARPSSSAGSGGACGPATRRYSQRRRASADQHRRSALLAAHATQAPRCTMGASTPCRGACRGRCQQRCLQSQRCTCAQPHMALACDPPSVGQATCLACLCTCRTPWHPSHKPRQT